MNKKWMKSKFIILLFFITNISFGQFFYQGKILDVNANQPIEGVNLVIVESNRGGVTNQEGEFKLRIEKLPVLIIFSHIGYEEEKKLINSIVEIEEIIYLLPKTNQLNEITVIPEDQVESISDVGKYSINDFEILNEKIYRLEYQGIFKKYTLSVTNLLGEIESSIRLSEIKGIESLYKSCNDIIYVLSTNNAYSISFKENKLVLGSKIRIDRFNQFLKPCQLRKGNKLYYINEQYNGIVRKITMYNIDTDEFKIIKTISNKEQLERYKEEIRFISESQNIGSIGTTNMCENERIRNIQEEGDFLLTVFYKPEFPVCISTKEERIVILNHIEKKIEIYNKGILESEIAISYVMESNWLKEIKIDQSTEKIYGIFDFKEGIGIKEINLENGTTKLVGILNTSVQNYKNIEIYKGRIFYLKEDRPNGSIMELLKYRM